MECRFWKDCNISGGGCCALNLYGGQPSAGVCQQCPHVKPVEQPIQPRIIKPNPLAQKVAAKQAELKQKLVKKKGCGCRGGK